MAYKRTKTAPVKSAVFDLKKLSVEQQEAVVEEFLGVHPRFLLYSGLNIKLNHGKFRADGNAFNGWKPASNRYNSFEVKNE